MADEQNTTKQTEADKKDTLGEQPAPVLPSQTENKIEEKKEETEEEKKQKAEREEQERTKMKKALFLEYYAKSFGVISDVCEKTGVGRSTFYEWKKEDEDFAEALAKAEMERNDEVEDYLFRLIRKGDGPTIRFYLERKNPAYKQKVVNEVYTGERTLEDLLDEHADAKITPKENGNTDTTTKETASDAGQQDAGRETPQDTKQEGPAGAVQNEPSPAVLLGEKDAPKPDTESETKGNQ